MNKAIFFDRDGVINKEIFRDNLKKWTAPHSVDEIEFNKNIINVLKKIKKKKFLIFIISNQPDYALGLTSLKNLKNVHNKINTALFQKSILIKEYFYSFRHKKSIKKNLGPPCFDKKPSPFFINKAIKKYNLDLINSWIIGDRQTDIDCGKRAGIKTIGVISKNYLFNKKNKPDFSIKKINQILKIIK